MAKAMSDKAARAKRKALKKKGKSGIVIKPQNKGKFMASAKKAGQSVQAHAHAVMNNPKASAKQKRRANFAIQAKKWHHGK